MGVLKWRCKSHERCLCCTYCQAILQLRKSNYRASVRGGFPLFVFHKWQYGMGVRVHSSLAVYYTPWGYSEVLDRVVHAVYFTQREAAAGLEISSTGWSSKQECISFVSRFDWCRRCGFSPFVKLVVQESRLFQLCVSAINPTPAPRSNRG